MSRRRVFFRPRSASKGDVVDEQSDLYRRIDELLSKPTDEQVREQRALNDLMVGVRDAIARLTGDVAALSARVSETREYAERLADRPAAAPEGAGTPDLTPLIHVTVPEALRASMPAALRDVVPE